MSALDPNIGLRNGIGAFVRTVRESRVAKALGDTNSDDDIAKLLRAMWDGKPESMKALKGIKIGDYSAEEVMAQAQGVVVGGQFTAHELTNALQKGWKEMQRVDPGLLGNGIKEAQKVLAKTGPNKGYKVSNVLEKIAAGEVDAPVFSKLIHLGRGASDLVEDTFRLSGYVGLIKSGFTPTEAAMRTAKAYVDYNTQSSVERFLRQIAPFARFQLGMTPVAVKGMAQRPLLVTPAGHIQRSMQEEGTFIPSRIRETMAIPMGVDASGRGRFLTNLGLPFETVIPNLALPLAPVGGTSGLAFRRQALSQLHPMIKTPLEAALDQNLWHGGKFAEFRRAPHYAPGWAPGVTEYVNAQGTTKKEVPGWVNAWLVGALPTSRASRFFDRWSDENRGFIENVVDSSSGIQIKNVDHRRAAERAVKQWLREEAERGEIGVIERFFEYDGKQSSPELERAINALAQEYKSRRKRK